MFTLVVLVAAVVGWRLDVHDRIDDAIAGGDQIEIGSCVTRGAADTTEVVFVPADCAEPGVLVVTDEVIQPAQCPATSTVWLEHDDAVFCAG